jgi:DNA replication protein DnaC
MSADLATLLTQVQLPDAAAVLPAWLDRAAEQQLSYAEFLHGLLEEEVTARATAATTRRLREAAFPFAASIEQFDFRFRPDLKRQVVLRYLDPAFVEQAGTLTLIGPPGLGKTMLAICVATKQVQLGYTARFVTAQTFATQVARASTSVGRQRLLRPLLTCDVPAFGPALYEVIAGRYRTKATIITSNKSLTDWGYIVQDVSLAAALVDRLMERGQVFYLKGPSWRTKDLPTALASPLAAMTPESGSSLLPPVTN